MLSSNDRIAFSLQIVSADDQVNGLDNAKAQIQIQIDKMQNLDNANANLFTPVNSLVNSYQGEYSAIDANLRTSITEQDIQDSGNRKLQNFFFPNDINTSVPSLAPFHNIWTKVKPFAITYAIGKNYVETYGSTTGEINTINSILGYITASTAFQDIENTSGQQAIDGSPGPDIIQSYPAVVTLKTNIVAAINTLVSVLNVELSYILTNDSDPTRQAQNDAAIAYINTTFLPAINLWLSYVDFNPVPGSVTTFAQFYAYNPALLAPTKLHSTQLAALQTALNNRLTFLTTRVSQLQANLGTIVQDLATGDLTTSTGFYGRRYGFLSLRLNALDGSLTKLLSLTTASSAQSSIKQNILDTKAIYQSVVPTSLFQAAGNETSTVHLVDVSFLSPGDNVFVCSETQPEIQRSIKSISGNAVVLNDSVSSKYRPIEKARLYKDLT